MPFAEQLRFNHKPLQESYRYSYISRALEDWLYNLNLIEDDINIFVLKARAQQHATAVLTYQADTNLLMEAICPDGEMRWIRFVFVNEKLVGVYEFNRDKVEIRDKTKFYAVIKLALPKRLINPETRQYINEMTYDMKMYLPLIHDDIYKFRIKNSLNLQQQMDYKEKKMLTFYAARAAIKEQERRKNRLK